MSVRPAAWHPKAALSDRRISSFPRSRRRSRYRDDAESGKRQIELLLTMIGTSALSLQELVWRRVTEAALWALSIVAIPKWLAPSHRSSFVVLGNRSCRPVPQYLSLSCLRVLTQDRQLQDYSVMHHPGDCHHWRRRLLENPFPTRRHRHEGKETFLHRHVLAFPRCKRCHSRSIESASTLRTDPESSNGRYPFARLSRGLSCRRRIGPWASGRAWSCAQQGPPRSALEQRVSLHP